MNISSRNYILKTFAVCIISAMVANSAMADSSMDCKGTVSKVAVHGTDKVIVQLSGTNTLVYGCNLSQTIGALYPISPAQCKAAYATLLLAYSMKKPIRIFFDNVKTGTQCNNFETWEMATFRYVELSE